MVKLVEKKKTRHYFYTVVVMLTVWHILSKLLNMSIIPSPIDVLINLSETFFSKIFVHTFFSTWRIIAGVLLAIILGVPIGLCMGYFHMWDRILSPFIYFQYPIPKMALLPIVMLVFGLGEFPKIIMIILIVIFQVVVAVRDTVKNIPEETYYPLYSIGGTHLDIFKEIVIPASLPKLLTTLRIAIGTAISVLFFTETFGTEHGMGYFIMDAWMRVNYLEMYAGILVLSSMGFLLFVTIDYLEKVLCPWRQKKE
ncbi:ABC transporter permease [Clostridiaceae bacterium 35-E11]